MSDRLAAIDSVMRTEEQISVVHPRCLTISDDLMAHRFYIFNSGFCFSSNEAVVSSYRARFVISPAAAVGRYLLFLFLHVREVLFCFLFFNVNLCGHPSCAPRPVTLW